MKTKWQFQNLALQKALQDHAQQPTAILPVLTLPIHQQSPPSLLFAPPPAKEVFAADPFTDDADAEMADLFPKREPVEADSPFDLADFATASTAETNKKKRLRIIALALCLLLALTLFITWHTITSASAAPTVTQQNLSNSSNSANTIGSPSANNNTTTSSGTIQVYILGAVVHPGVYTLSADARVYQLLRTAGGPLPDADLVTLNLAAKLSDGQEVYVLRVGEVPPSNLNSPSPGGTPSGTATPGQLVNINTATEAEMKQALHISAATAQKIITYRTQHGLYTAVNQLLQAISQSIYNRIKGLVTV